MGHWQYKTEIGKPNPKKREIEKFREKSACDLLPSAWQHFPTPSTFRSLRSSNQMRTDSFSRQLRLNSSCNIMPIQQYEYVYCVV